MALVEYLSSLNNFSFSHCTNHSEVHRYFVVCNKICVNVKIHVDIFCLMSSMIFMNLSLSCCELLVQARGRCAAAVSRSCQNLPLGALAAAAEMASQTTVSAPCSTLRSLSFILAWKSGMALLTAGVSAQPGCMTLQWMAGCLLAHSSVSSTCCRLFWA